MLLIWTRAAEDWDADAALLAEARERGVEVLRVPCIATAAVPARPQRAAYEHLVFTSRTAVARAVADPALQGLLRAARAVHTHGAETAKALREAGVEVTLHTGVRTAEALAAQLPELVRAGERVGWPTAAAPAFDLAGALARQGIEAEAIVCYETRSEAQPEPEVAARIEALATGGQPTARAAVVCFASPSAVAAFHARFPGAALAAAAIGPTTAAAAMPHFAPVVTAASNALPAMVAAALSLAR